MLQAGDLGVFGYVQGETAAKLSEADKKRRETNGRKSQSNNHSYYM